MLEIDQKCLICLILQGGQKGKKSQIIFGMKIQIFQFLSENEIFLTFLNTVNF